MPRTDFCAEYPVMYVGSESSAMMNSTAKPPRFRSSLFFASARTKIEKPTIMPTVGK